MNLPLAVVAAVCVWFFMPLKKVHGTAMEYVFFLSNALLSD